MIIAKQLLLVLTVIALLTVISTKEGVIFRIRGNSCSKFNPKYLGNITCRVRAFNRTTQLMSYGGDVLPGIILTDLLVEISSYRKFGLAYRPSLVKLSENWCAAMNGSFSHYVRLMLTSFTKYGNVIRPCPYTTGRYYVKDMIVDTSIFPPFVPIGDYRFDYTLYTLLNGKREFLLFLQDYWNVKPLGAIEF